jgi:cellulose synthase/poly-beta-1,6-N-acetylglucosamine synthase-like glycosyltransferase
MDALSAAFTAASPRATPVATPLRSLAIHGGLLVLWLLLFAAAFRFNGVLAWSVGLAYAGYDTLLLGFTAWQLRRLASPASAPTAGPVLAPSRQPLRIGVVIATYNEAAALPATVDSLLQQSRLPNVIVIADDGSDDATAALLTGRYGLQPPRCGALSAPSARLPQLRWLRLPHGGKARALNAALMALDCDVLLTVDADTLLQPAAIAAFVDAFATEPGLVAATGVLTPACSGRREARLFEWFQTYEYIRNFLSRYAWMQLDSLLLISGACAAFRREAVLAVGGFDADCLVEDYELVHRLRRYARRQQLPWTFRVLGTVQARTDAPATVAAFLRQRRRWFGGFLQTQYWYREMVGDRRYGWLGTLMLPVKAADTLQPLYGLTAFLLLLAYAAAGRINVLTPVAAVIAAKIGIDLAFHLASVRWYRRWVGDRRRAGFAAAFLAAIAEPFSFQLLRHSGAAWGWWSFLSGRSTWERQRPAPIVANTAAGAATADRT